MNQKMNQNQKRIKTKMYFRTLRLIVKAFNINKSIPKGYGTRSSDYEKWYQMKYQLLKKAINYIQKHSLSIKYGIQFNNTNWPDPAYILYFLIDNNGKPLQLSFHGLDFYGIKKYNGSWSKVTKPFYLGMKKSYLTKDWSIEPITFKRNVVIGKNDLYIDDDEDDEDIEGNWFD